MAGTEYCTSSFAMDCVPRVIGDEPAFDEVFVGVIDVNECKDTV